MPNHPIYQDTLIPLSQIHPDPDQPRKQFDEEKIEELASNIKQHGQIEPVIVTPDGNGGFKIIQGERRFRAIQKLSQQAPDDEQWQSIKASVVDGADPILSIISSIVRQDLNPMEFAEALQKLKESCGKDTTNRQLANLVGKSENNISERLSLNDLPDTIKAHAKKFNLLPFRVLKQIAALKVSEQEKEEEYSKLCNAKDTDKTKDKSSVASQINKRVNSTSSHLRASLASMKQLKRKLDVGDIDTSTSASLIQYLGEIIAQAEELRKRLDPQPEAGASTRRSLPGEDNPYL